MGTQQPCQFAGRKEILLSFTIKPTNTIASTICPAWKTTYWREKFPPLIKLGICKCSIYLNLTNTLLDKCFTFKVKPTQLERVKPIIAQKPYLKHVTLVIFITKTLLIDVDVSFQVFNKTLQVRCTRRSW